MKLDKNGKPVHPNSLKNLGSAWNSETAKEASKLGAEKRRQNQLAREQLKMSMAEWSKHKEEILDTVGISALDTLKIIMMKHLDNGDYEAASDIAKNLAEFEKPKLQRVEQKVEEIKADDLSDAELEAKLKDLLKDNE